MNPFFSMFPVNNKKIRFKKKGEKKKKKKIKFKKKRKKKKKKKGTSKNQVLVFCNLEGLLLHK